MRERESVVFLFLFTPNNRDFKVIHCGVQALGTSRNVSGVSRSSRGLWVRVEMCQAFDALRDNNVAMSSFRPVL